MKNNCGMVEHEYGCDCKGIPLHTIKELGEKAEWGVGAKSVLPYVVRRKIIYKGQMAPNGQVYLVINWKANKKKWEAKKLIMGGLGKPAEDAICKAVYEQCVKKYNL